MQIVVEFLQTKTHKATEKPKLQNSSRVLRHTQKLKLKNFLFVFRQRQIKVFKGKLKVESRKR